MTAPKFADHMLPTELVGVEHNSLESMRLKLHRLQPAKLQSLYCNNARADQTTALQGSFNRARSFELL